MKKQKWYKSHYVGWIALAIAIIELIAINTYYNYAYPPTAINPHYIENASHGMVVAFGPNDIILAGRAGYEKNISGNMFKVQLCEECGTENDCLKNNLNRIHANNYTKDLNITLADLKYFYVFAITQNDVTKAILPNDTDADAVYYRVFESTCNNKDYWVGIK